MCICVYTEFAWCLLGFQFRLPSGHRASKKGHMQQLEAIFCNQHALICGFRLPAAKHNLEGQGQARPGRANYIKTQCSPLYTKLPSFNCSRNETRRKPKQCTHKAAAVHSRIAAGSKLRKKRLMLILSGASSRRRAKCGSWDANESMIKSASRP